jgi:Ca-activated chloride channel family protein
MNHVRQSVCGGRVRWCSLVIFLFLASTARPQPSNGTQPTGADESQVTFEAVSELVVLPVSVTDKKGDFISGLALENFRVYEDGRLQKVTLFQPEDIPVTVGLIVDHSHSMEGKVEAVVSAIRSFAYSSNPEDEMFVVDFNDRVWPELFGGQTFTSNAEEVKGALLTVAAQGQTALYDAVYEGLWRLRSAHREKKALIVVSDGGDNASRRKYAEVLALAHQSRAIIYAIGLVGAFGEEENPRVLERLCKDTGGLAFFPHALDMVTQISNRIARDLREQYTIGYVPEKRVNPGEFRKVIVKVSASGRGRLHVRTRPGYSTAPERKHDDHSLHSAR